MAARKGYDHVPTSPDYDGWSIRDGLGPGRLVSLQTWPACKHVPCHIAGMLALSCWKRRKLFRIFWKVGTTCVWRPSFTYRWPVSDPRITKQIKRTLYEAQGAPLFLSMSIYLHERLYEWVIWPFDCVLWLFCVIYIFVHPITSSLFMMFSCKFIGVCIR